MADFGPRPVQNKKPWYEDRESYDVSVENAINQVEADSATKVALAAVKVTADAAATKASVDTLTGRVTATEGVANAAYPMKGEIAAGVDLNSLTTPGIYRQPNSTRATIELNYPAAGVPGVVWVSESYAGASYQRFTPTANSNTAGRGEWIRRVQSGVFQPWQFIPTQRVDNTAGRAIYTWDPTANREQLVQAHSGKRFLSATLINGWIANIATIWREGYRVGLILQGLDGSAATAPEFLQLPAGFTRGVLQNTSVPAANDAAVISIRISSAGQLIAPTTSGKYFQSYASEFSIGTVAPWQAALPGTADGTIPNL